VKGLTYLGIKIDTVTMELCLPVEKLQLIKTEVQDGMWPIRIIGGAYCSMQ